MAFELVVEIDDVGLGVEVEIVELAPALIPTKFAEGIGVDADITSIVELLDERFEVGLFVVEEILVIFELLAVTVEFGLGVVVVS